MKIRTGIVSLVFASAMIFLFRGTSAAVIFSWSGAPIYGESPAYLPSGSAEFSVVGDQLIITLTNTSGGPLNHNWQVLTGLTWDMVDTDASLAPVSAMLYNSVLISPSMPAADISGEWGFKSDILAAGLGSYGISSVGDILYGADTFGVNDRIGSINISGPASLNGVDFGIVGASFVPTLGTSKQGPFVQGINATAGSVRFTFNINGTLTEDNFSNVGALYGSSGAPVVPEPATLVLLGSGIFGLLAFRRIRRRNV